MMQGEKDLRGMLAAELLSSLACYPRMFVRLDRLTKEAGMPLSSIQVLVTVSMGDITIGEISSRLHIAKPNVTPLVDKLERDGLVERCAVERDKRKVSVHLTEAGRRKLDEHTGILDKEAEELTERLGESDAARLADALATLRELAVKKA